MRTAKEIYDRIRWDPGLDRRWFWIGFEDHLAGLVEVPFDAFVPGGDVPWHRIRRFRCGPVVVWDRTENVDQLASLRMSPRSTARGCTAKRFASRADLLQHLDRPGAVAWVIVRASPDYPGFVQEVIARTAIPQVVHLDVEWRSYAMDWMGDATNVSISYRFTSPAELVDHAERCFGVSATDFCRTAPPLPETTPHVNGYPEALVPVFQDAWRRLKADFSAGKLTLPGLQIASRFEGW